MDDMDRIIQCLEDGEVECECCGEIIELDGTCPDGTPSPVLAAGMI